MKVLVVDDDPVQRALLTTIFVNTNCVVVTAASGHEAYELIKKYDYEVIVIDNYFKDSNMEGSEFWLRMFQACTDEVVMIGISADVEAKNKFYENGADFVIMKPVHPKEIEVIVDTLRQQRVM